MSMTSSYPPESAPSSQDFAQYNGISTQKVIIDDQDVRDALVRCSRPIAVQAKADPKLALINEAVKRLRQSGNMIEIKKVAVAVETLIRKELIVFDPRAGSFYPTLKTQKLLSDLYIILCDNCGSSVVIQKKDSKAPKICSRCGCKL